MTTKTKDNTTDFQNQLIPERWTDGYYVYHSKAQNDWIDVTKTLPSTLWTHTGSFGKDWSKEQIEEWFEKEEAK